MLLLIVLFLTVFVARLLVYIASKWGTAPCNPVAFGIGVGVFVVLNIFPSTRELFFFRPAAGIATIIMVITDLHVMANYIMDDDKIYNSAES
ncbi:MAG: hypothetical protein ACKKL6_01920 [Candidatus Komeilibacteria bacterium]